MLLNMMFYVAPVMGAVSVVAFVMSHVKVNTNGSVTITFSF
jgi:hypothetical protein